MDSINQVLERVSCINQDEDSEHPKLSYTDQQCAQVEAAIKDEPPDSYPESWQEWEIIPVKEESNPDLPFLIREVEIELLDAGAVSKAIVDDSIDNKGKTEWEIIPVKEESNPDLPFLIREVEIELLDAGAVSKAIVDDSIDNKEKTDDEIHPSVNGDRDLNGDSGRSSQGMNECTEGTPKAVRKRRGHKLRSNIHLSDKPFQCKVCQKCFRKPEHLRCHELFHSEVCQFLCESCGKGFYTKGDLKRHERVHTGEKPYACPMCPKSFTQMCNMQSHLKKRCMLKGYGCDLCNKMFEDMERLLKHKAFHIKALHYVKKVRRKPYCQELPPFFCDMCSLCFYTKPSLIAHIKEHNIGVSSLTCKICGKVCPFKTRLDIHMRSHTGEKPFLCSVCGRAFSQQCNLKKHEFTHLPD